MSSKTQQVAQLAKISGKHAPILLNNVRNYAIISIFLTSQDDFS